MICPTCHADYTPIRPQTALQILGHRIRTARRDAGLTQYQLALAVGYFAANPISKLELGNMPTIDIVLLWRIAGATWVTIEFLISGITILKEAS